MSDGIGQRDAGQVDALVRADGAAGDDRAARATALDVLDAEPHVAVVDQDVVAGPQHRAEDGRADGDVVALGDVLARDHDRVAVRELDVVARCRRRGASAPAGRR